jgi:hypothetical protein
LGKNYKALKCGLRDLEKFENKKQSLKDLEKIRASEVWFEGLGKNFGAIRQEELEKN